MGAVVFGMSSPRKTSWISYNKCFGNSYNRNCTWITEKLCLLEVNHSNNTNNNSNNNRI